MGLVEAIHPSLGTIDYKQPMVKLVFIGGSSLFFSTVFLASALVSTRLEKYRNLRLRSKVSWNLAFNRFLFGVFGTVVGSWAIWWDEVAIQDVVNATTPTGFVTIYVTVGFLAFETLVIVLSDLMARKFDILFFVHHVLALQLISCCAYFECFHYFALSGLILEMPVPFDACISFILVKIGWAESLIWKVNQALVIHTFHLRSAAECFLWVQTYLNWHHMWEHTPFPILVLFLVGLSLLTFVMTPYWDYMRKAQLFKSMYNSESPDQDKRNNVQNSDVLMKKNI